VLGDALLHSADGLETAAALIGGIPDAVSALALAAAQGADRDIAVRAPPGPRVALAAVCIGLADRVEADAETDEQADELGALALYLLARMSAGDAKLVDAIADALEATQGFAGQLVAALGELRVIDERAARALAPLVGPDSPIGARIVSAAVCGRCVPAGHALWDDVRDLLELGTVARAAAWSALRDRARRT
jgi:hypothetical protein